jgi:hypothetical protein
MKPKQKPHFDRRHKVGLVLRTELCTETTVTNQISRTPSGRHRDRERSEQTCGVGDGGGEAGEVDGILAFAHGGGCAAEASMRIWGEAAWEGRNPSGGGRGRGVRRGGKCGGGGDKKVRGD